MSDYYDKIKEELKELIEQYKLRKDELLKKENDYDEKKKELIAIQENMLVAIEKKSNQLLSQAKDQEKEISSRLETFNKLIIERQKGFPLLAKAYEEFLQLQDKSIIDFLAMKSRPAVQTSKILQGYAELRRVSERENKILKYTIEFYESMVPSLAELKEEVPDITEEDRKNLAEYSQDEQADEVTKFVTKDEYRKFTSQERNQLALDRYWKRPKSKWHIGKIYERYVGYLFEEKGYNVEYHGIFKGLEDLGRDILADNGKELVIIQCKNWSKFKTIYEKHIFQFFGTLFQYKDENKGKNVRGIFYTTTSLSDLARRFAKELKIELIENDKINTGYPCIKCNISRTEKTKIYHLPFDQQYDNIKIEKEKGEFYCSSVKEAEDKGFRRAFKYSGIYK